LFIILRI